MIILSPLQRESLSVFVCTSSVDDYISKGTCDCKRFRGASLNISTKNVSSRYHVAVGFTSHLLY